MKIKKSLIILLILSILLIAGYNIENKVDMSCRGCNVLLLNIELLRADYVGLINQEVNATPNIDEFFKNGIIFEQASSSSGSTYLSVTSVHTSTEAMFNDHKFSNLGISIIQALKKQGKTLIDHMPTIAETLQDKGYDTLLINQWIHSGKLVFLDRGYDEYIEFTGDEMSIWNEILFEKQIPIVHDKLLENKDKLFFINFHTNSLHNPFIYPANRIEEKPTEPYKKIADDAFAISFTGPGYPPRKETLGPFPKNETNNVMYKITMYNNQKINVSYDNAYTDRKKYTNQIQYIDEELEKIFSLLEEKKMLDNTIVVLFSNHGLGLWDQGISVMGVSYQSNVHIPILIKHPKIKEQIRIKTPISPVDLGPTIYEMLGIKMNQKVSGHSLIPLITKGKYGREFIFGQDLQMEYVREGNWKLIVKDVGEKELYNLWQDPHEEENVYDLNIDKARKLGVALRKEKTKQIQIAQEMKDEFDISNST